MKPGSFPGMRSFAIAPMTRPMMIVQSIAISKRRSVRRLSAFYELHRSEIAALSEAAYSPIVPSPNKAITIFPPATLIAALSKREGKNPQS